MPLISSLLHEGMDRKCISRLLQTTDIEIFGCRQSQLRLRSDAMERACLQSAARVSNCYLRHPSPVITARHGSGLCSIRCRYWQPLLILLACISEYAHTSEDRIVFSYSLSHRVISNRICADRHIFPPTQEPGLFHFPIQFWDSPEGSL